jgi:hypothetical protein
MPSTYTDILRLELQADGENDGTWGQILNDNVIALVEDAIAGTADVSTTGGTTALSTNDGAEDQARKRAINVTGSLASDAIIEVPAQTKPYRVINGTSGSFTVEVLVSGQSAGNGVVVPQGARQEVWCDGTNVEPTSLPLDDSGVAQNFTSTGIDDNASSTAVTVDGSGNFIVNGTSADGALTVDGLATDQGHRYKNSTRTISDDSVYSFEPTERAGILVIQNSAANEAAIFQFSVGAPRCQLLVGNSSFAATTGSLSGTTGNDGDVTVSANDTDNKIYIENRGGFDRFVAWSILAARN